MPTDTEYGTKARLLRVMRALIERPYGHTKSQLAAKYGVHPDTIANDLAAFGELGLEIDKDPKRHRYAFVVNRPLKQVKSLLYFSEEERSLLHEAIQNLRTTPEQQAHLLQKLHALYDYSKLGFANLRKPHLTKVDILEQAQAEKRRVVLEGYHSSNSSQVGDRLVEPFHVVPADDMLHAFDVEKHAIRHFRLTRFVRVKMTDSPWQHEGSHNIMKTDPFRIVNNNQVNVHLRLSVGAYNELIERYPLTRQHIEPTDDPNFFDFQGDVNSNFYGLSNFILGFYHLNIQVYAPESLREHLRAVVSHMNF
ncbi:MAG: helix-turn-helix transcriptional regulator [Saprospiraceae bacterium]